MLRRLEKEKEEARAREDQEPASSKVEEDEKEEGNGDETHHGRCWFLRRKVRSNLFELRSRVSSSTTVFSDKCMNSKEGAKLKPLKNDTMIEVQLSIEGHLILPHTNTLALSEQEAPLNKGHF